MTPIQQLMLGVGGAKKTYMDDLFSTYVYRGTGASHDINNGINLSGEGGMVWIKNRAAGGDINSSVLADTVRGGSKYFYSNLNWPQETNGPFTFNSNGFNISNSWSGLNENTTKYASWTWRKTPGFFDIVTYSGDGVAGRTVSHNLGCVPGCIMIKRLNGTASWKVYHRSTGAEKALFLDTNEAAVDSDNYWNDTEPTASVFTLKQNSHLNASGGEYVAYLFAGGESTNTLARSVDLDGDDYLNTTNSSSDFTMGTGDFTIECWAKPNANSSDQPLFHISDTSGGFQGSSNYGQTVWHRPGGNWVFTTGNGVESEISGYKPAVGVWYHMALVRNSGTTTLYINGRKINSATDTTDYNGTYIVIGGYHSTSYIFDGKISNFRVVKGTAVYTSSFRPPTEPLTNITNTKLLCCNNSSVTGSTVTPVTINSNGNPAASTDSPFDDPAAFTFGANEDQNVIKCGSYVGNGSSTAGPEINLGFEPQWLMIKNTGASEHWSIFDSMRGLVTGGNDEHIKASSADSEYSSHDWMSLTPTGFKINTTAGEVNQDGKTHIFIAIRRSDGYVGKPPELGTGVFAMDAGNSSATQAFTSGFPVDFALDKKTSATSNWEVTGRLIQEKYLLTNSTNAEATFDKFTFDDNTGWNTHDGYDSNWQSWMWKRHAGFTVCTWVGDGTNRIIPHDLSKAPEMIWIKNKGSTNYWIVGHKGLNGGTNPWEKYLRLSTDDSELDYDMFQDLAPTSTHFAIKANDHVNENTQPFIAMLFASTDVSKVGSYDGSDSDQTITLGFQPRFVIVKSSSHNFGWLQLDSTKGWATSSGNNSNALFLNSNAAQVSVNAGYTTSTGFVAKGQYDNISGDGVKYIYYAHA